MWMSFGCSDQTVPLNIEESTNYGQDIGSTPSFFPDAGQNQDEDTGLLEGGQPAINCGPDDLSPNCLPDMGEDLGVSECIPDCTDRNCESDGCGGQCGIGCSDALECDETTGQCTGTVCNADQVPCGGTCPGGQKCSLLINECVQCIPECTGRVCGSNGCGGQCGTRCLTGQACDDNNGQCRLSAYGQGYWRFESNLETMIEDQGPYGLIGRLNSLPSRSSNIPFDSISLNGDSNSQALNLGWQSVSEGGYVRVEDKGLVLSKGANDFTFEAWVKLDILSDTSDVNQRQVLFQKKRENDPDTNLDYMILVQRGPLSLDLNFGKSEGFSGQELQIVFGTGESIWSATSNLEITDTQWHFVSIAINSTTEEIRFGLDTTFETLSFETQPRIFNDGPLLIGGHQGVNGVYNHFLRGSIDEARLSQVFLEPDQLLNAPLMDCNGNQVWDSLDLVNNTPDCNLNGKPDSCDLMDNTSADCQGDGVPDECQLTRTITLAHYNDLGSIAWRADVPYMAWITRFDVQAGARNLDSFEMHIGTLPAGTLMNVYVWSDPNGDGNPRDAQILWEGTHIMAEGERSVVIDVPEIDLGNTGSRFFVGCILPEAVTEVDFPAQLDFSGHHPRYHSWGIGSNTPIDPTNLQQDAIEYGTLENLLFAGSWVISVKTIASANDCNANGLPDECDIAAFELEDLNCNYVPDLCEDCDGNQMIDGDEFQSGNGVDTNGDGILDSCQLTSNDCNQDGIPDHTQLGPRTDCNDNRILDECDLLIEYSKDVDESGIPDECEDCNLNGTLDSIDLENTISEDCNADTIPDECQFGKPTMPILYNLDDGTRESQISISPAVSDIAWLNQFSVVRGGEFISEIQFVWGETYPGMPAKIGLWSDPNGDGDPSDAQVLQLVNAETQNVNEMIWNKVPIPPTYIGPPDTSFFVGIYFDNIHGTPIIAVDADNSVNRSWLLVDPDPNPIDLNNLVGNPSVYLFPFGGLNFFVRAVGSEGIMSNDCDADGILDQCDQDDCF